MEWVWGCGGGWGKSQKLIHAGKTEKKKKKKKKKKREKQKVSTGTGGS